MLATRSTPLSSESDHWFIRYPDTVPLPRYWVEPGCEISNLWIAVVTLGGSDLVLTGCANQRWVAT